MKPDIGPQSLNGWELVWLVLVLSVWAAWIVGLLSLGFAGLWWLVT